MFKMVKQGESGRMVDAFLKRIICVLNIIDISYVYMSGKEGTVFKKYIIYNINIL